MTVTASPRWQCDLSTEAQLHLAIHWQLAGCSDSAAQGLCNAEGHGARSHQQTGFGGMVSAQAATTSRMTLPGLSPLHGQCCHSSCMVQPSCSYRMYQVAAGRVPSFRLADAVPGSRISHWAVCKILHTSLERCQTLWSTQNAAPVAPSVHKANASYAAPEFQCMKRKHQHLFPIPCCHLSYITIAQFGGCIALCTNATSAEWEPHHTCLVRLS